MASRPAGPRVPGGVARAAQDSRLPPPAVGVGPALSTALSRASCAQGWASCHWPGQPNQCPGPGLPGWAQWPPGHRMPTRPSSSTQGHLLTQHSCPRGQEHSPSSGACRGGPGLQSHPPYSGWPTQHLVLSSQTRSCPWGPGAAGRGKGKGRQLLFGSFIPHWGAS